MSDSSLDEVRKILPSPSALPRSPPHLGWDAILTPVSAALVVQTPEEAASQREGAYDYVIVCIKALPDVYDLASVIDSVVTPQHTCILLNTTNALGLESAIEARYPTNVVLSFVCGAELSQLAPHEFEHKGSTEVWVGPANKNSTIPVSIQEDMAQALAMTLSTGQVDCKVSNNIRQEQYERVIGLVQLASCPLPGLPAARIRSRRTNKILPSQAHRFPSSDRPL